MFDNDVVIGAALVLYVVEFVADKIPWLDSLWDAIHTLIRPVGGALIAVAALGDASPTVEGLVALLGGTLAAGTHFTKAGTRAAANTSPEPFSNWALSLAEDAFVVGLSRPRAQVTRSLPRWSSRSASRDAVVRDLDSARRATAVGRAGVDSDVGRGVQVESESA